MPYAKLIVGTGVSLFVLQAQASALTPEQMAMAFGDNAALVENGAERALSKAERDDTEGAFLPTMIVGAVVDTGIYLVTTDRADWDLQDAGKAALVGAATGIVPGGKGLMAAGKFIAKKGISRKVATRVAKHLPKGKLETASRITASAVGGAAGGLFARAATDGVAITATSAAMGAARGALKGGGKKALKTAVPQFDRAGKRITDTALNTSQNVGRRVLERGQRIHRVRNPAPLITPPVKSVRISGGKKTSLLPVKSVRISGGKKTSLLPIRSVRIKGSQNLRGRR